MPCIIQRLQKASMKISIQVWSKVTHNLGEKNVDCVIPQTAYRTEDYLYNSYSTTPGSEFLAVFLTTDSVEFNKFLSSVKLLSPVIDSFQQENDSWPSNNPYSSPVKGLRKLNSFCEFFIIIRKLLSHGTGTCVVTRESVA